MTVLFNHFHMTSWYAMNSIIQQRKISAILLSCCTFRRKHTWGTIEFLGLIKTISIWSKGNIVWSLWFRVRVRPTKKLTHPLSPGGLLDGTHMPVWHRASVPVMETAVVLICSIEYIFWKNLRTQDFASLAGMTCHPTFISKHFLTNSMINKIGPMVVWAFPKSRVSK